MNDEALRVLRELKDGYRNEIQKLTLASNPEISGLQSRQAQIQAQIKELANEERVLKAKMKEIKDANKGNQPEMLELMRKIKAIDQLMV